MSGYMWIWGIGRIRKVGGVYTHISINTDPYDIQLHIRYALYTQFVLSRIKNGLVKPIFVSYYIYIQIYHSYVDIYLYISIGINNYTIFTILCVSIYVLHQLSQKQPTKKERNGVQNFTHHKKYDFPKYKVSLLLIVFSLFISIVIQDTQTR